ncbi:MAG TPA: SDR family NAD(P)-dependent oxidoreductase [Acidimicrobiales bacterium]|nr:SDR family NAD(P)-dependent oxidoreductase [Acidimicrobiales bacterium]
MAPSWTARYADLAGKAVIVAGDQAATVVEVVRALAASGALVAVVAADRAIVDAAATGLDDQAFAMAADPTSEAVWSRIVPHVEQRLGPIDVVVTIGAAADRVPVAAAVVGDMAARGRGVVIEVGPDPAGPTWDGVRRRHIVGGTPEAVVAAVLLCASDAMPASGLRIELQA